MHRRPHLAPLPCSFALGLACLACANNPVHDQQVEALGPEVFLFPTGPLHRAGQPCLACHGAFGPASTQFSVAGTVYSAQGDATPAVGATVLVEDIAGSTAVATTNSVGNFYVRLQDYQPTYPIQPQVSDSDGGPAPVMSSYVARDGSCAGCHSSSSRTGPVYLRASMKDAGTLGVIP